MSVSKMASIEDSVPDTFLMEESGSRFSGESSSLRPGPSFGASVTADVQVRTFKQPLFLPSKGGNLGVSSLVLIIAEL